MDITYKVNALSFAYDEVYTINGVAIKFSLAQMYISGFHIEDDKMNEEHFESKYLLVKPGTHTNSSGTMTSFSFT